MATLYGSQERSTECMYVWCCVGSLRQCRRAASTKTHKRRQSTLPNKNMKNNQQHESSNQPAKNNNSRNRKTQDKT